MVDGDHVLEVLRGVDHDLLCVVDLDVHGLKDLLQVLQPVKLKQQIMLCFLFQPDDHHTFILSSPPLLSLMSAWCHGDHSSDFLTPTLER